MISILISILISISLPPRTIIILNYRSHLSKSFPDQTAKQTNQYRQTQENRKMYKKKASLQPQTRTEKKRQKSKKKIYKCPANSFYRSSPPKKDIIHTRYMYLVIVSGYSYPFDREQQQPIPARVGDKKSKANKSSRLSWHDSWNFFNTHTEGEIPPPRRVGTNVPTFLSQIDRTSERP